MILTAEIARRIIDRVASGLDKPFSVADATGHVLASTDASLVGRQLPALEHAMTTGELAQVEARSPARLALPLIYLDQIVGVIVLDDASPPGHEIARVAKTLAELIIHQMVIIEHLPQQAWVRDKFISDLLHEHMHGSPEVMLQEAALLGIDLRVPRSVALIDITSIVESRLRRVMPNDSLPRIARTQRLTQIHTQLLDRMHMVVATDEADIYSFIDDHRMILLATVDPADSNSRQHQLAHDMQRFLNLLATSESSATSAGIGGYHDGWPALAQSYMEAQFALRAGTRLYGSGHVYQAEDLGLVGFVCSDDRLLKAGLTKRLLQPLAGEPELLATLEAFLHADLSPSTTARTLHIHRHTLAYRLEKIAQLTGHDPRIFATAAQFSAALIVQQVGYLDD